jgi:hypothetical protein
MFQTSRRNTIRKARFGKLVAHDANRPKETLYFAARNQ